MFWRLCVPLAIVFATACSANRDAPDETSAPLSADESLVVRSGVAKTNGLALRARATNDSKRLAWIPAFGEVVPLETFEAPSADYDETEDPLLPSDDEETLGEESAADDEEDEDEEIDLEYDEHTESATSDASGTDAIDPDDLDPDTSVDEEEADAEPSYVRKGPWQKVSYLHPVRKQELVGWVRRDALKVVRQKSKPKFGYNLLLPWQGGSRTRVNVAPNRPQHHKGLSRWAFDFDLDWGTPVVAAHAGRVKRVRRSSSVGGCDPAYATRANYVAIDRGDGIETLYVHLKNVRVKKNQFVKRGQQIGVVGATGYVCGSHLHFQVQEPGKENRSIRRGRFWDSGLPWEPRVGTNPQSRNAKAFGLP